MTRYQPLISVIVPFFNVLPYIDRCLKSIQNQTYTNLEIICIDDYSTDGSILVARSYKAADSRFQIIENDKNKGLGSSRNVGLSKSTGQFIAFIDSDDFIEEDYIECLYKALIEHNADVSISAVECFENDKSYYQSGLHYINNLKNCCFPCNWHDSYLSVWNLWPSAWNKLFRRNIIEETGASFSEGIFYEDHRFHYMYFSGCKKITYVQKPLYFYRSGRAGSITTTSIGREIEIFQIIPQIFSIFEKQIKDKELRERVKKQIAFRLTRERSFVFQHDEKIKFIKLSLRKFKDLGLEIKSSADVDDFIDRQDFFLSLFLNSNLWNPGSCQAL